MSRSPGRPPAGGGTSADARRVLELEGLVQALKRVVEKQRSEADRKQRSVERLKQQLAEAQRAAERARCVADGL